MTLSLAQFALDAVDPRRLAQFWTQALNYRIDEEDEGIISLVPVEGDGPPMDILAVAEPKSVKNRMHLDLRATGGRGSDEVQRLLGLGAVPADVGQEPDVTWTVLADPEGNEFCILGTSGE